MKKRIFAIIAAACLAWSVVPMQVFADDGDEDPDNLISEAASEEETSYDPDDYLKEGLLSEDEEENEESVEEPEEEASRDPKVAYPEHDFSYSNLDMQSALLTGKYYRTRNAYYKDEANVFNDDAYFDQFSKLIQDTADATGMHIGVFLGGLYRSDSTTEKFTVESIKTLFSMEWDSDSVFLYLDFEGKNPSYDYICTCHDAKLYYTDSGLDDRIEKIIQDMYRYLPSSGSTIRKKSVESAINVFASDLKKYKNRGPVWDSSYFNEEKGNYRYVLFGQIIDQPFRPFRYWYAFLGAGIVLGLIIGIFSNQKIRRKYKFRELQKASVYTSNNMIRFNEVRDNFLHEHTTKVYIPPSDSGSGGGGGGGGGGGSFGGGGGHR